jgi:hypothetical protein
VEGRNRASIPNPEVDGIGRRAESLLGEGKAVGRYLKERKREKGGTIFERNLDEENFV